LASTSGHRESESRDDAPAHRANNSKKVARKTNQEENTK